MIFSRFSSLLLFVCLLFAFCLPVPVSAQFRCACRCCSGNNCSPTNVGSFDVSSCGSCSNTACASNFAGQCPGSGQSGSNSASCSSVQTGSSPNWVGSWKANNQCDQSRCCCVVGDYSISKDNSGVYSANFPTLRGAGSCPGSTTINFGTAPGSSNSFTSSASGQSVTYTLSGDANQLSAQNNVDSACSGLSTRNSAFSKYSLSKGTIMAFLAIGLVSAILL